MYDTDRKSVNMVRDLCSTDTSDERHVWCQTRVITFS